MKIHFLLIASILALLIGGCASGSSMTDEEQSAAPSPAPRSPDPMSHMATPPGQYPLDGGSPRY